MLSFEAFWAFVSEPFLVMRSAIGHFLVYGLGGPGFFKNIVQERNFATYLTVMEAQFNPRRLLTPTYYDVAKDYLRSRQIALEALDTLGIHEHIPIWNPCNPCKSSSTIIVVQPMTPFSFSRENIDEECIPGYLYIVINTFLKMYSVHSNCKNIYVWKLAKYSRNVT